MRFMTDTLIGGLITTAGTVLLGLITYVAGRRRGQVEASTMASADNREWAAVFLARLSATEAKLDVAEAERDAERKARIDGERECARQIAALEARVGELERALRRGGLTVPGDTPPEGTPPRGGAS